MQERPVKAPIIWLPVLPEILLCMASVVGIYLIHGSRATELFWTDEIITVKLMGQDWMEIITNRYWQGHSPLYFVLLKLWLLLASGLSYPPAK